MRVPRRWGLLALAAMTTLASGGVQVATASGASAQSGSRICATVFSAETAQGSERLYFFTEVTKSHWISVRATGVCKRAAKRQPNDPMIQEKPEISGTPWEPRARFGLTRRVAGRTCEEVSLSMNWENLDPKTPVPWGYDKNDVCHSTERHSRNLVRTVNGVVVNTWLTH